MTENACHDFYRFIYMCFWDSYKFGEYLNSKYAGYPYP